MRKFFVFISDILVVEFFKEVSTMFVQPNENWIIAVEAIAFAYLAIAAATDIKNRTIMIGLFPSLIPISLFFGTGLFGPNGLIFVVTGIGISAGMLVPVLTGRVGGGDLIMLGCLAMCFGPSAMFLILAGILAGFIVLGAYKAIREKSFCGGIKEAIAMNVPIAPLAAIGFVLYVAVKYQFGGILPWVA